VQKELDIVGARNATVEDFDEVIAMLTAGRYPVEDAVSLVVPLEEAGAALERWSEDPASMRKILVEIGA
jgi:threonine dehydrogenase-like Zn-dependent dehydrogenase